MSLPTIRVSPSNLPKFSFLLYGNYLSEYKTEIDKARVRYNLGIPDSLSFKWGNIGGSIELQIDVINLVNQTINNKFNPISDSLTALTAKATTLSDSILTIQNDRTAIQIANNAYKDEIEQRFLEIEREVSLNAALIKLSGADGAVVELSSIDALITALKNRVTTLENNSGNVDLTGIRNQIQQLETDNTSLQNTVNTLNSTNYTLQTTITSLQTTVSSLQTEVQRLQAQVGINGLDSLAVNRETIEATTASDNAQVVITATFTNGSTRTVTSECDVESSNTNVAIWNNGIDFVGIGEAIITFTYSFNGVSRSVQVQVTVTNAQANIPTQYVGYAADPSLVIGVQKFATDTIAKTWTPQNTPIETASVMGFWVITTQDINTFSGSVGDYRVQDLYLEQRTLNGVSYKVYMAGPVSSPGTFRITIQ